MQRVVFLLALAAAAVAAPARASEDLAKKHACLACHAIDKKLVGPSYKDIAKRYAGQTDAEAKLSDKVKQGGSGVWGAVPMAPNPNVSDADVRALVKWILATK